MLVLKVLGIAVAGLAITAFGVAVAVLGLIGSVIARENKDAG